MARTLKQAKERLNELALQAAELCHSSQPFSSFVS